jgi:hypothetical protein
MSVNRVLFAAVFNHVDLPPTSTLLADDPRFYQSLLGPRLQSGSQEIGLSLQYATYGQRKYELKTLGREAIKMLFAILNAGFIYGLIWLFERKRRELLEFDFDKIAVIPRLFI